MISNVARPICYNDFYTNRLHIKKEKNEAPLKVKIGAMVGSAIGTASAVYIISKNQNLKAKAIKNIFNIKYTETGILGVALCGIFGGLVAGTILDDKKYSKAKTKEAMHQAIANVICPLLVIGAGQKVYEKSGIDNFVSNKANSVKNKFLKSIFEITPRLAITITGLISGVYAGTFVSNKINHFFDKKHENRKIKPMDFMYHPDDIATTLVLSDRNGIIQKTLGKIIPPIFTICGYETGIKR